MTRGPEGGLAPVHDAAGRLRLEIVQAARRLDAQGLNRGTSGNIGLRSGDHFIVTPSGVPVDELSPKSIVEVDFSGAILGPGTPSSEWRMHRDLLAARPEVNAVVHTHSQYATSLACLHRDIPAFHYMIAIAGGDSIRCTPYATFGSQALSDLALDALQGRKACLLGNHGQVALGRDLAEAMAVAIEVESLCAQYWAALQIGQPKILTAAQMREVLEKFSGYGRRPSP